MDIGINLLGGNPMGFYEQPPEIQADLLAYRRILKQRDLSIKYALLSPKTFDDDVTLELLKKGKMNFKNQIAAPEQTNSMPIKVVRQRMEKRGADSKALDFWLSKD